MLRIVLFVFTLSVGLFSMSCGDDSPTEPDEPVFTGILETDANGKVLGGDERDFQPRPQLEPDSSPVNPLNISLHPAFPNPSSEESMIILYQITEPDSVSIFVLDRPNGAPIDTLVNWFHQRRALYAVILENPERTDILRIVMESGKGFRTFGDVQFKN